MKHPLIIDRPDLQAWQQKAVFGVLTALFWVFWMFLWLPLVTLFGWWFFGYQFKFHMLDLEGYRGFAATLAVYALVIAVMGGSLMLWAKYNHLRFRGVDRRKDGIAPSPAHLALLHSHPEADIARWQTYAVVTVHHDAQGAIQQVEPAAAVPQPDTAS